MIEHPRIFGVVAERDDRILGFNFLGERDPIRGVDPIVVDPAAEGRGVGQRLMTAVLDRAAGVRGVRPVQEAFNMRSLALYAALGFETREPLVVLIGKLLCARLPGWEVRPLQQEDLAACAKLYERVHGHPRANELRDALTRESNRNRGAARAAAANGAGWTLLAGMAGYKGVNRSWSVPSRVRVRGCRSLSCPTVSVALVTYIDNNAAAIPDYGERQRSAEPISTAFIESTVNLVVGKRFAKKQQMQWSKAGAHLLLQTRIQTLDGTLRETFRKWYPAMAANDAQMPAAAA